MLTLDPSEKLLFLYLLTNPLTSICGVYEISLQRIAFDTGFEQDTVNRILQRFEHDKRCIYRDGWLAMRNWLKHQTDSPKVQKGIQVQMEKVPGILQKYVGYPIGRISHLNPNTNTDLNPKAKRDRVSPRAVGPIERPAARDKRIAEKKRLLHEQAKLLGVKVDSPADPF